MLIFGMSSSEQKIILSDRAIKIFEEHRQTKHIQNEGGGQLFATIEQETIIIQCATIPDKRDRMTRTSFWPNRSKQIEEINTLFVKGLHYVGDWHTHPEFRPLPSYIDIESMKECFLKSKHELKNFILIIVGNSPNITDIWLGIINSETVIPLQCYGFIK